MSTRENIRLIARAPTKELLENLILVINSKKFYKSYIKVEYNLGVMRQSACVVLNPITVYSYDFLFNCTTVGQATDSMSSLT